MFKQFDEYNSQLFEQCPIGLVLCRTDGTLININSAYAAILGRTVPETLNLCDRQITPENYAAIDRASLENLKQTSRYGPYEKEIIHKDGHLVPVRISGLMIEKDGEQLIWCSVEDISDLRHAQQERQHTEKILKQSEARYRSLVTATAQIVWLSTPEGICFEMVSWVAYTGQTLAETENGGWINAVHPDDRDRTTLVWGTAVTNLSLYEVEYRIRSKDGSYRHFFVCGAPVIAEDGSIREWVGTCTDIHDRKLAEQTLQQNEQRFRSLVSASSQMVWTASLEGMVNAEIAGWEAYTGQSAAEMMGWGWLDVMHPDDRPRSAEVWSAAVANRSLYQLEYQIRAKDGTYRYFFGNAVPVLEADGSIREWIGTCTDIHDRKVAEQTLQRSEERFRSLVTATSQIVWVATPDGLAVSSEMLTWMAYSGQSEAEVQDWGWIDAIHPDDRDRTAQAWSNAVAMNQSLYQTEYRLRGKDGSYRHFAVCGAPVVQADGSIREWIGTCTDIQDRKLAEAENQRLMNMLNHSSDAVIVRDFADKITHWSQGAERLYGWNCEEVKNQDITHNLLHTIFPKPLKEIQTECLQQGTWFGELQHLTRDGRYIIVQSRWTMQLDASGQRCATLEINTDITARKQAEVALRQLNQELETRVLERTAALQNTLAESLESIMLTNCNYGYKIDSSSVVQPGCRISHFKKFLAITPCRMLIQSRSPKRI